MHVNCLTWNVRSLNNKVDRILAFAFDRDISLLFIQETWLTDANNHTTAVIKSHGFKVHHAHRAEKAGGGVAIIYRPCIALIRVFTTSYESFECVSVKVSLPGRKSLLCMCIYRTGPMGSFISDFDNLMTILQPSFLSLTNFLSAVTSIFILIKSPVMQQTFSIICHLMELTNLLKFLLTKQATHWM